MFNEYSCDIELYQLATPLLAPMIEQGFYGNKVSKAVLEEYLKNENFNDKEAILLACTHYPLIKNEVDTYFNHTKVILDNADPMANAVKAYLGDNNLLAEFKLAENQFYVTEYSQNFETTAKIFHSRPIHIEAIDIHHEF